MKTIEIIVSPKGTSRVETKGFSGSDCREASRFIETALGKTTAEELTAEYHHAASVQQTKVAHQN